jgi:Flp pilus assembly protein TadD
LDCSYSVNLLEDMEVDKIIHIIRRHLNREIFHLMVVFALLLLLSACVTTGGNTNQVKKISKKNCSSVVGSSKKDGENKVGANKDLTLNPNNCLPKGVIEITESYGVDPEIRSEFNQAVHYLNQENYPDAIKLLRAVSGKTSKFSAPYINLGIAYARTGELKKAEENFRKALDVNKQHPVANNELGLVYRKTGRYVEARLIYETLISTYPEFLPARKNLGVLCDIYIQDLNCALEQYEEYLKGRPEDEKVKIWVADVKSRM